MEDERLKDMERDISDLRVSNATLSSSVEHFSEAVKQLTATVGELRDTMNRGRGVLWAISGGAGLIGALGSFAASKLLGAP